MIKVVFELLEEASSKAWSTFRLSIYMNQNTIIIVRDWMGIMMYPENCV